MARVREPERRARDWSRALSETTRRAVLIASLVLLCWLAMQVVHEAGHVLAAWATGGHVTAVVLHPLAISRTDVAPNPRPLAVVWAGPVFGVLAPVAAWLVARALRAPSAYLWRFFAGFCLVANGAYIGSGAFAPVGDAADLLRLGAPAWSLAAFGLITFAAGLLLWNGLGTAFGFGKERRAVRPGHVWAVAGLFVAIIVAEVVWTNAIEFR